MRKVFLFAIMIAAFFAGNVQTFAQGDPPPPPPLTCQYSLSPLGAIDSDDGFATVSTSNHDEVHFVITSSGVYMKYTNSRNSNSSCGATNVSYITMGASAWYADRQSYLYGSNSSNYSQIPESLDWD